MEGFTDNEVITIPDFWGKIWIPAILRKSAACHSPERSEVWIPTGYENGGGGYSTRNRTEIKKFEGSDDVKKDVMKQWAEREYK